jgi:hypothetical protein
MNRKLYLTIWNYLLFAGGLILLITGYYLMTIGPHDSFWSLTLSPIIIMFSLVIVFPMAILINFKKRNLK